KELAGRRSGGGGTWSDPATRYPWTRHGRRTVTLRVHASTALAGAICSTRDSRLWPWRHGKWQFLRRYSRAMKNPARLLGPMALLLAASALAQPQVVEVSVEQ